jgi:capsular polysaccharide export protein
MSAVTHAPPHDRVFLFLQGPHGPFFWRLARALRDSGAAILRVGFNRGDRAFWPDRQSYVAQTDPLETWPDTVARLLDGRKVTDLVVYGDTRPIHATAIAQARQRGITVHVFEEGYLRPYWITYERGGANGHSPLMGIHRSPPCAARLRIPTWTCRRARPLGRVAQHVFYGALYHCIVLLANRRYAAVRPHRALSVRQEFRLYLKRLALMPWHWLGRVAATRRILRGSYPYHLALLQLEHDASFRDHGPFATQSDFVETVIDGFAAGAPAHHHLVFKAHPLEDGRIPLRADIRRAAAAPASPTGCISCAAANSPPCSTARSGRHRELHRRATGALARTSAQVLSAGPSTTSRSSSRISPWPNSSAPEPPDSAAYRCSATTC